MNPKKIKSIIALLILFSSLIPITFAFGGYHDPDWYRAVQGVTTTDTYDFYPYSNLSMDFGFSKFGEMIYWDPASSIGLGLQYPGYDEIETWDQRIDGNDAFAKEPIAVRRWLNGWFLDIRYTHTFYGDRRILTMSMFADGVADGSPSASEEWIVGFSANDFEKAPYGGRKTTGYAETDDLVVLYDGPRKYIAMTKTSLYDWQDGNFDELIDHPEETTPIVDVTITFIFNKAKKQVILLKDVKETIEAKDLASPINIQLSNREEVDIGPSDTLDSFAHFWHQEYKTCYGEDWHMAPGILRDVYWDKILGPNPLQELKPVIPELVPWNWPAAEGSIRLYVNGEFVNPADYTIVSRGEWGDPKDDGLHIVMKPGFPLEEGDYVEVIFKIWKYVEECSAVTFEEDNPRRGVPHLYDVVQVIGEDNNSVLYKAFWPVLSDYTPYGWDYWTDSLTWINEDDMPSEPAIPFTIGEWDTLLGKTYPPMFRGVEVVGLTEHHHSLDANMTGVNENVLESEVRYLLEEVFNPWDLEKAVHKETRTWVEWVTITSAPGTYITRQRPFALYDDAVWGLYNDGEFGGGNKVFSERVYDLSTNTLLRRWHDYQVDVTNEGYGEISGLPVGDYKIMYHTKPALNEGRAVNANFTYTRPWNWGLNGSIVPIADTAPVSVLFEDNMGVYHGLEFTISAVEVEVNDTRGGGWSEPFEFEHTWDLVEEDFKVYKEDDDYMFPGWHTTYVDSPEDIFPPHTLQFANGTVDFNLDWKWYNISSVNDLSVTYPLEAETLHVDSLTNKITVKLMMDYNGTHVTTFWDYGWEIFYNEMLGGRWEHTVVGKEAASVDSIGAALVTAAFKNKQVEIGIGSLDMEEDIYNYAPWVMRKFGDGMAKTDYYHNADPDYAVDVAPLYPTTTVDGLRTSVMDDWCHTWAISGANLISVGGPGANLLSYYAHDFSQAMYGYPEFSGGTQFENRINAVTCWNKNSYSSFDAEDIGYAVISTYHDINGTTLLSIWGHFGRDTYYATRFFHEELIEEFQKFDPCITDVILEIDYTDPKHPTFDIVEVLGTISEKGGPFETRVWDGRSVEGWTETWKAREWILDPPHGYSPPYLDTTYTIYKGGIHDP
jgi:hypothetical protein